MTLIFSKLFHSQLLREPLREIGAHPARVITNYQPVEYILIEFTRGRHRFQLGVVKGAEAGILLLVGCLFEGIHCLEQAFQVGFHPPTSLGVNGSSAKCFVNSASASPWLIALLRLFQESSSWRTRQPNSSAYCGAG